MTKILELSSEGVNVSHLPKFSVHNYISLNHMIVYVILYFINLLALLAT